MTKIGLIDDNNYIRDFYSSHFRVTRSFNVVFSVGNVSAATMFAITNPDIILLNAKDEAEYVIRDIEKLQQFFPDSKIVVISTIVDPQLTARVISHGATGFLLKTSSVSYISESLMQISEGGMPFSPTIIPHLIQPKCDATEALTGMTRRELQLIKLLSEGFSNKLAGELMDITYFTVNQHLKNIYKKLTINSKPELISWYLGLKNHSTSLQDE